MQLFKTIRAKFFLLLITISTIPFVIGYWFDDNEIHPFLYHWMRLLSQLSSIIIISFLIAIYLDRRLKKLIFITKKINKEDFSEKIVIQADDEIGDLGKELNHLFEKLQKNKENFDEMLQKRSRELVLSEKKHRELLNVFADVIYELDCKHCFKSAKHIKKALGYTEEEVIGKSIEDFIIEEDRVKINQACNTLKITKNKSFRDLKLRILSKSGEIHYMLMNNRCEFKNNKLHCSEGFLRDITSQEQLSQKILEEQEKQAEAYKNLHQSYLALGKINAQVAALAEINTTFSSNLDWKEKLHYIIESVRAFMQADETLLFLRDSKAKKYVFKKASLDSRVWENTILKKRDKVIKEILKYKKPIKHFDLEACPLKKICINKGFKTMLIIPIIINNEVIGIFYLVFKETEKIKEIHTKLTLAYTSQMAIALMMSGELDHSLKKIF